MTTRVKESETTREEEVNVHLALSLSRRGFSAKAERRSRQGVPDVRVALRSGLVLLECKWEGSEKPLETNCKRDGPISLRRLPCSACSILRDCGMQRTHWPN